MKSAKQYLPGRLSVLLVGAWTLVLTACGGETFDLSAYREPCYTPHYATGFDVTTDRSGDVRMVTVYNPWQSAEHVEQHLLLLPEGATAPRGFDGQVLIGAAERIICLSSSHVAMLEVLDCAPRIVGVSGIDFLKSPYITAAKQRGDGRVQDVGYDNNIDFECIAALRPDMMLLYGVTGENTMLTGKLRELQIPYIYIGDYMEQHPLGKAEWLMAVAEICGCADRGAELFEGIAARYETLKAQYAAETRPAPQVMLNTPYRDTWFMPSSRSYIVRLLEDAGGRYIYTKNDSSTSVAIDMEEAYLLASRADVWLYTGGCNTMADLTAQYPKFAVVPAVRHGRVWNNTRRSTPQGGSDFWESGIVRPDRILEDLHTLLFSEDEALEAAEERLYYYNRLK